MIGRWLIVLIGLFFFSDFAYSLDLWECFEKAKKKDPKFQSVYYEYRAVQTLPRQALAGLLPQISLNYYNYKYDFVEAPFYYRDYRARTTSLTLTQPVFKLPSFVEYRQSKIRSSMGERKYDYALQDLIRRVSQAYFDVLYYEEALRVVREERQAILEHLKMIKRLFERGEATLTDVNDAEARYSNVEFRLIDVERSLYTAKNNLQRIIGEEPGELVGLKEPIEFPEVEPKKLEDWIEVAKRKSNLVRYYALSKDVAQEEIKKETYVFLPQVELVAGYTQTNTNDYVKTQNIDYYIFGFQIKFNLFNGGYNLAKRAEAIERFKQSEKDYEATVLDVIQQVVANYYGVRSAQAQSYSAKVALRSAEVALESTKKGFRAGIRTFVDVLNAESAVYKAKLDLVKARYDFIRYWVELRYYTGILTEDDLRVINSWLTRN